MGVLHIMDLPRNLRRRVPNEVQAMNNFLKRELQRCEYVAACGPTRTAAAKIYADARKAAEDAKEVWAGPKIETLFHFCHPS